ncbi:MULTISPECIES: SPFH domain-containing protein [Pseudomonas]|uniref:SPFH domain-containing protein n=1 Tax=Pseudomonas TaxID=286 RepID=UPI001BECC47F|nr:MULTISPECIES: SPFH domain-containing protein [Pseudomonas]MBT2339077.1 SPFH domain-containing protein [Pseudomonas fluorescens]MCD4528175.1 hypothetical protein [Pseudomonas sp. C3-2018]
MRRTIWFIGSGLAVIAVTCVLASLSFYTINEKELGLILRNGKIISVAEPGPGWRLPFADTVVRLSSQKNILHVPSVHNYTLDLHEFNTDVSVAWHVAPDKIAEIYTRYNDTQSVELAFIKPKVTSQIGLVMSRYKGLRMFEQPDQFIKDSSAAIKMATGDLVIIDSVNFEKPVLADLDRSDAPAAVATEAAAP